MMVENVDQIHYQSNRHVIDTILPHRNFIQAVIPVRFGGDTDIQLFRAPVSVPDDQMIRVARTDFAAQNGRALGDYEAKTPIDHVFRLLFSAAERDEWLGAHRRVFHDDGTVDWPAIRTDAEAETATYVTEHLHGNILNAWFMGEDVAGTATHVTSPWIQTSDRIVGVPPHPPGSLYIGGNDVARILHTPTAKYLLYVQTS